MRIGRHASEGIVEAAKEAVKQVLVRTVFGLWDIVNDLTRLRPSRRERYRVTIFGSARVPKDHWVYLAVRDLAAELARLGCDIVTGGGPGLMEAANEGVKLADQDGLRPPQTSYSTRTALTKPARGSSV